jgi:hypothetical protein
MFRLESMYKNTSKAKFIISFDRSSCLLLDDSADRVATELLRTNQEFSSIDIILPWFSMFIYNLGMNSRFVGGRSSETLYHPIDMTSQPTNQSINQSSAAGSNYKFRSTKYEQTLSTYRRFCWHECLNTSNCRSAYHTYATTFIL